MRRLVELLSSVHRTAGPAGTLLIITVLLVFATSLARATEPVRFDPAELPAVTSMVAQTPERLAPGEAFDIAVELDAPRLLHVYLPGLDQSRVPLAYDPLRGVHVAELTLPWFAPPQGHCTLRIVDGYGLEFDVQVELGAGSRS